MHHKVLDLAAQLDQAYVETITVLAKAVETRDAYTGGHVERVRYYSACIAERLGISGDERRYLECGAVLHDVGKIAVPDLILGKRGPLSRREWRLVQRHPLVGRQLLAGITFLGPALEAVATHHERWDGTGYPRRLKGDAIPLPGRVVAVADAYDAMTTDRPYRPALPPEAALDELKRGRGTQFDPDVVDAFLAAGAGQAA